MKVNNKVIDCYITGIKDEIQKKYPGEKLLNKYIPNNFYINHKNKNVIMYVTDNNLFEQMIEKEIIPNKKNIPIFGTLVNNPTGFIVCYDFLLPLIQIYKDSYIHRIQLQRKGVLHRHNDASALAFLL